MRAAPWPEPVGETEEVRLVDGAEHLDDGPPAACGSGPLHPPDRRLRPGRLPPAVSPRRRRAPPPASAAAALLGGFAGTTERRDCPGPFTPGFPPQRSLSGPPW